MPQFRSSTRSKAPSVAGSKQRSTSIRRPPASTTATPLKAAAAKVSGFPAFAEAAARGVALSHWRRRFSGRGVDQVLEVLQVGAAADGVAVDEEVRGAVYAQAVAFLAVLVYLRFEAVGVQVSRESGDV
jgi:hypothetical protein